MQNAILNIRPMGDAERDAASLKRRGVPTCVMPLLEIVPAAFTPPEAETHSGLIFTSRHAISAFVAQTDLKDWVTKPVYVVGQASAAMARQAGFATVLVGTGGGAGLTPLIVTHQATRRGPLLWVAGVDKSFDMETALKAHGIAVTVIDAYAAKTVASPDPAGIECIAKNGVLAVIVMSARSAKLFGELLDRNALDACRAQIILVAGSQAIAAAAGLGWRQILVAKHPRRSRLLAIATLLYHRRDSLPATKGQ